MAKMFNTQIEENVMMETSTVKVPVLVVNLKGTQKSEILDEVKLCLLMCASNGIESRMIRVDNELGFDVEYNNENYEMLMHKQDSGKYTFVLRRLLTKTVVTL